MEEREGEIQQLAMLPKRFWVRPRTVWKLGAKCGGKRANVLHPHGQHLGNAAGLWFYGSPCILRCWHENSHKEWRVCSSWEMELRAMLEKTWNKAQASKSQHLSVSKGEKKCSRGIQFFHLQPQNTTDIQRCCDRNATKTLKCKSNQLSAA